MADYNIDPGETPESRQIRRKLALALMGNSFEPTPIQHPMQGVAKMAQALMGGLAMRGIASDERAAQGAAMQSLVAALNPGAAGAPAAKPSPSAALPGGQDRIAKALRPQLPGDDEVTPAATPQDYINRAFGMTPKGRDIATRTVLGEASNQGPAGMQGVADVMANRSAATGQPMDRVALAKGQFEPWMTPQGQARMASFPAGSPAYNQAQTSVDNAAIGTQPDITGGATHFYSPQAQAQLGRSAPAWAGGAPTAQIGGHAFYRPEGGVPNPPAIQQAQAAPAAGGLAPGLLRAVTNPNLPAGARPIANALLSKALKDPEYDFKDRGDGSIVAINKKNPNDLRIINPGDPQSLIDFEARKKGAIKTAEMTAERAITAPDRQKQERQVADIVTQDIDRAIKTIDKAILPTTGFTGGLLSNIGGTAARDVAALIDTVKANSGFQELNKMRQASPTGGALGSITERELALLQATVGNLEQSQSETQFKDNARRVKNTYLDIIHGPGNGPAREKLTFQDSGDGWTNLPGGVRIREKR